VISNKFTNELCKNADYELENNDLFSANFKIESVKNSIKQNSNVLLSDTVKIKFENVN